MNCKTYSPNSNTRENQPDPWAHAGSVNESQYDQRDNWSDKSDAPNHVYVAIVLFKLAEDVSQNIASENDNDW